MKNDLNLRILLRCFCLSSLLLVASASCPGQETANDHSEQLVARFEAMVDWTAQQEIVRKPDPIDETRDGYRLSMTKELHIEFLAAASRLENETDVAAIFPVKVTGFSRMRDTRKSARPQTTRGGDLQRVKLTITGLLDRKSTPRATIRDFQMKHGTDYDAVQMVRDTIISAIRSYLPHVEVEGRQRFFEKKLAIRNETSEAVRVFIYQRRRVRTEQGYQWQWLPNVPGQGQPHVFQLAPRESRLVEIAATHLPSIPAWLPHSNPGNSMTALHANRVRLRAESESGQQWGDLDRDDLWLVDENPRWENERCYYAESMETFTHPLTPQPGDKVYTERLLKLRNDTQEPLLVNLLCHTRQAGQETQRYLQRLRIEAGQTIEPRFPDGFRVRASKVHFVAQSDTRRFDRYEREPLWLVPKVDGARAYRAGEMGSFTHVFSTRDSEPRR